MLTVDLQIQGHVLFCVTFHISGWVIAIARDLGVYFHIFDVKDHNSDITNTAMLTVDLKIQGHALFCVTFRISDWIPCIKNSRPIFSFYMNNTKDHNDTINNTETLAFFKVTRFLPDR